MSGIHYIKYISYHIYNIKYLSHKESIPISISIESQPKKIVIVVVDVISVVVVVVGHVVVVVIPVVDPRNINVWLKSGY